MRSNTIYGPYRTVAARMTKPNACQKNTQSTFGQQNNKPKTPPHRAGPPHQQPAHPAKGEAKARKGFYSTPWSKFQQFEQHACCMRQNATQDPGLDGLRRASRELLNSLTRPRDFSLQRVSAFDGDRELLDAVLENARNEY